jgi:hypothetical protein
MGFATIPNPVLWPGITPIINGGQRAAYLLIQKMR